LKLQIALDDISLSEALDLVDRVHGNVDIIEIGTPLIIAEGLAPVRSFRARYPNLEILADTKIVDAGEYEAQLAFDAGAHYVTALGVADFATIEQCLKAAQRHRGTVVIDMICVDNLPTRVDELERLGVNALAVHTGVDQQRAGRTPLGDLRILKARSRTSSIFVAGGINSSTIANYVELGADVVIVGGAIRHASDPAAEARALRSRLRTAP
jgi:3-hexulose-6-phosphate synthase